jgi:hypothetical protein
VNRARFLEGMAAFDAVFTDARYRDSDVVTHVWVRAVADASILAAWIAAPASLDRVRRSQLLQPRIGAALLRRGLRSGPGCGQLADALSHSRLSSLHCQRCG